MLQVTVDSKRLVRKYLALATVSYFRNYNKIIAHRNSLVSLRHFVVILGGGGVSVNFTDAYALLEWADYMKLYVRATKHKVNTCHEHLICLDLELTPTEVYGII